MLESTPVERDFRKTEVTPFPIILVAANVPLSYVPVNFFN
jgi:hypothetical protein